MGRLGRLAVARRPLVLEPERFARGSERRSDFAEVDMFDLLAVDWEADMWQARTTEVVMRAIHTIERISQTLEFTTQVPKRYIGRHSIAPEVEMRRRPNLGDSVDASCPQAAAPADVLSTSRLA